MRGHGALAGVIIRRGAGGQGGHGMQHSIGYKENDRKEGQRMERCESDDGGAVKWVWTTSMRLLLGLLVLDSPDTLPLLRNTRRTTLASRLVDEYQQSISHICSKHIPCS